MNQLDQPLRLKHGLAAVAAALTLGVAGTAIAGGAGQKDAVRANATTAGGGGGGTLHYRSERRRNVNANSQAREAVVCHPGEKVLGGGVKSTAGFKNGGGMMINTSAPSGNDVWFAKVDVFQNGGGEDIVVYAICKG
jgi:hypothetical protein